MTIEEVLARTLELLRSGKLTNEAQIKQAAVIPILRALDWDDTNPDEVLPQYDVELPDGTHRSVDYTLFLQGAPVILIEANDRGDLTVDGVEEIFEYAERNDVPVIILTNGKAWDLFLSSAPGVLEDRRFLRIELQRHDRIEDSAKLLNNLLRKGRVDFRRTRNYAEQLLETRRKEVREAVPRVWHTLLNTPDSSLYEVIKGAVERTSGYRPSSDDLKEFLTKVVAPIEVDRGHPKVVDILERYHRIVGFVLNGEKRFTGAARPTLIELIKEFHRLDSSFMISFATKTRGRTRRLVAKTKDELYDKHHLSVKYSEYLENGWWIGTNINVAVIRKYIRTACEIMGFRRRRVTL